MILADYAADMRPLREVRAAFSQTTIRIYQAFSVEIATSALAAQRLVAPFKRGRMTWIKPSFTWMMYRSGWATKPGQEHVLGLDVLRSGFEWALAHACLSHFDSRRHGTIDVWRTEMTTAPVRVQWDPERTVDLRPLPWRSVQLGLGGEAVDSYVDDWVVRIDDVTPLARTISAHVTRGEMDAAQRLLPSEVPYPVPDELAERVGVTARLTRSG